MKAKKKEILQTAGMLFSQRGIKITSLDLIAQRADISKQDLAAIFSNKENIISEIVKNALKKTEQYLRILSRISPNLISELNDFFEAIENLIEILSVSFISDLLNFYPSIYKLIKNSINNKFIPFLIDNIECGKFDGLYKESADGILLGRLYFQQLYFAIKIQAGSSYEKFDAISFLNNLYINSIVNTQGLKLLMSSAKH